MTVFKASWDLIQAPNYLVLYEGLAYPVQTAYSCGQWTLWVDLPQDKPHNWPKDCDAKVPDKCLMHKGPVLRNGFEELRREIDGWVRGERQFSGVIPAMPSAEEMAAAAVSAEENAKKQMVTIEATDQPVLRRGPGRPRTQPL